MPARYRQGVRLTRLIAAVTCTRNNVREAFVMIAIASALTGGCCRSQQLPPLLVGARAGGGWYSACPPQNETERQLAETSKLAI